MCQMVAQDSGLEEVSDLSGLCLIQYSEGAEQAE